MATKKIYPSNVQYDELEAMQKRLEAEQNVIAPTTVGTPQIDPSAGPKPGKFDHIFGTNPATQQAYDARNTAFQSWLNSRKQAVQQQRTDDVKMARANALGNLLTTMVQPLGWAIGGKGSTMNTGGVQKYDDRQYLEAFNRAVKATDDLRNIGSTEDEYKFKLADENYKRQLSMEDEARLQQYSMDKLAEQYQQKADLAQRKFEQDMEKEAKKAEYRRQLAEFNAANKITGRSGGTKFTVDERTKLKLLDGYMKYAQNERDYGHNPKDYQDWLKDMGYAVQSNSAPVDTTATSTPNPPAFQFK